MPPTVDLSTCECEAVALVELTKDGIFFSGILKELHLPQLGAIPLYNDNESTWVNRLMKKSKEQVVKFLHLSTEQLPADLGTKLHTGSAFKMREAAIMG